MRAVVAAMALAGLTATACSSVGGSAVRTGPLRLPPHVGAVSLFLSQAPAAAQELGVVEVHASQSEDGVETHFEIVAYPHVETYSYPCGWRGTCVGTRMYTAQEEVMTLSMRGRAM